MSENIEGSPGLSAPRKVAKPAEVLQAAPAASELFVLYQKWFEAEPTFVLDLTSAEVSEDLIRDPMGITAMAMRKLQGLRQAATSGWPVASDTFLALVTDLERALDETGKRLLLVGKPDPRPDEQSRFNVCCDVVSEAGDAVGRLCQRFGGEVVLLQ